MEKIIMPSHLHIEQVNGICSAKCTMCRIHTWTKPSTIMSIESLKILLEKFLVVKEQKFLTFHGAGEILLDNNLPSKVALAKQMGYKGTGFASNCTHLSEDMATSLLEAGLDTIICSVDGIKKETHENIRVGTNFDSIINNILKMIELRNKFDFKTRIFVRFIRQESNFEEWDEYNALWNSRLNAAKGDSILRFDVHNWGESNKINRSLVETHAKNDLCPYITEHIIVRASGNLAFCCADDCGYFNLGNAFESDPIQLYNSGKFVEFRKAMFAGKLNELHPCKECSIIQSRKNRIAPED